MNLESQLPNYQELTQALVRAKAFASAAEAHGMLCGFICAGHQMDGRAWMEPILGTYNKKDPSFQENRGLLLNLYEISSHKLQGLEFDFQLLLPREEETLRSRAHALTQWCQGFLSGLGFAGVNEREFTDDGHEALRHLSEIAKLDYETIDIREEDEKAFFEVAEYVRVVVLMIYGELAEFAVEDTEKHHKKQLH